MTRFMMLATICVIANARAALGDEIYAAFWNVENLFDTTDDPAVELDEEYTPASPKRWTDDRLETKLEHLARVISDMNHDRGPDVLGLCEVENIFVLERLIEHLQPLHRDYGVVHRESPSGRGIDCALLFDRDKLELQALRFIHVAGDTREIVQAKLAAGGHRLTVFVNHWPSRGNDERERIHAAEILRGRIDKVLEADDDADILVMGDLNDDPTNHSVRAKLRAKKTPSGDDLLNTMWPIHENPARGTYFYDNAWQVLDHLIVSPGLLDPDGFRWKAGSTTVIANDYQLFTDSQGRRRPRRTYARDRYFGGYSDHLPVACVLEH